MKEEIGDRLVSDCTHPNVLQGAVPGTGVCLTCGVNFYQGVPEK